MAKLGENLKRARMAAGLTQEEAAAGIGVSKQAISGWERDQFPPKEANIAALATLYQVAPAALRYGGPVTATEHVRRELRNAEAHRSALVSESDPGYGTGYGSEYDAGYAAAVFESIAADARHIMEKALAARVRMLPRETPRAAGATAAGAPPAYDPSVHVPRSAFRSEAEVDAQREAERRATAKKAAGGRKRG